MDYTIVLGITKKSVLDEYFALRTLDATNSLLQLVEIGEQSLCLTNQFQERYHLTIPKQVDETVYRAVIKALSWYHHDLRDAKKEKLC